MTAEVRQIVIFYVIEFEIEPEIQFSNSLSERFAKLAWNFHEIVILNSKEGRLINCRLERNWYSVSEKASNHIRFKYGKVSNRTEKQTHKLRFNTSSLNNQICFNPLIPEFILWWLNKLSTFLDFLIQYDTLKIVINLT